MLHYHITSSLGSFMKKTVPGRLGMLILLFVSFAYAAAATTSGVVVTIKPLHSLVAGVIGDTGRAVLLVGGNASPHDFQLKPSQVSALEKAEIVFYVSDSLETFLPFSRKALSAQTKKSSDRPRSRLNAARVSTGPRLANARNTAIRSNQRSRTP